MTALIGGEEKGSINVLQGGIIPRESTYQR